MSEGYLLPIDTVKEGEKEASGIGDNTPQDTATPNVTIVSALLPVKDTAPQHTADDKEEHNDEPVQSGQDKGAERHTDDDVDSGEGGGHDGTDETVPDTEVAEDEDAQDVTGEDVGGENDTGIGSGVNDVSDGTDGESDGAKDESAKNDDSITSFTNENKMRVILKALKSLKTNLSNVIGLLEMDLGGMSTLELTERLREAPITLPKVDSMNFAGPAEGGRVTEGVFNGNNMVGSDGKLYTVPPNYASKSKLVEGDLLKLTITPKGSFIYKQIGPIERSRVIGTLGYDQTTGEWYATTDNRRWNVIKASVTYFKGEPGDEIVLLVPKNAPSKWGAVENIIKQNPLV